MVRSRGYVPDSVQHPVVRFRDLLGGRRRCWRWTRVLQRGGDPVHRHRDLRTAYGITTRRALIVAAQTFADIPLQHEPVTVRRTGDGRHASVIFGSTVGPGRGSPFRASASSYYANTGLEPWARNAGLPFAFYDVADPDSMLAALDRARAQPAA